MGPVVTLLSNLFIIIFSFNNHVICFIFVCVVCGWTTDGQYFICVLAVVVWRESMEEVRSQEIKEAGLPHYRKMHCLKIEDIVLC